MCSHDGTCSGRLSLIAGRLVARLECDSCGERVTADVDAGEHELAPAMFTASERVGGGHPWRWHVHDTHGALVDVFRTETGANYATRLLNGGLAELDHHAPFGCRVIEAVAS